MASAKKFGWVEFLTGFAAGTALSILFTRKNLKSDFINIQKKADEIKNQLIVRARNISSDLSERSRKFIETAKKFAEGRYAGTVESLEKEYESIRYAINSAIDNYKRNPSINLLRRESGDLYIDFEDEKLPKFIGMGKRRR